MNLIEFQDTNDYYVYMHIFPNGKKYIGYTHQKPNRRFRNGLGYKNLKVYDYIQKYGWDNIKHIILIDKLTKKQAQQKEIEFILEHKSNEEKYGYNLSIGTKLCEEQIELLRKKSIGNKNMLGKHHTEEAKEKIRQANLGKVMLEETKAKKSKAVIQYDKLLNKINEFYGIHEASRKTNINWTNIAECCKGNRKSAGGYIWKYKGDDSLCRL